MRRSPARRGTGDRRSVDQHPQRALIAVTAGYFLIMFAVSPVSVVLPSLADSLHVDVEAASWVMAAYLLPLSALLLPAGRLGDMVGHRRLFTLGLGLVTLAALSAGLAHDLMSLLLARAAQGAGAALVSAASLPIITAAIEPERRGRAIGLATMSSSLGAMAGTGLAPLFVLFLDWRWAFYTGGVAGAAALAVALRMQREPAIDRWPRLDWPGALLLLLTMSVASLSLNHFHEGPETFTGGWRWHLPMHAAAGALLVMFVAVERRVAAPLIRLDQLRMPQFTTAIGANAVLHMSMMMAVFSTPFLLQRGLGLGAVETGLLLTGMQACTTVMTLVGGWLYDRAHWHRLRQWLCAASLSMVAVGLTVMAARAGRLSFGEYAATIVFMGIGSGAFMTANNTRIMSALAPEFRGFASGMLETTRQYGHTLGVAVATAGMGGVLSATVAGNGVAAAQVVAGFGSAALMMAAITWAGVALAAYPFSSRRWRTSDVPAPRSPALPTGAPAAAFARIGTDRL
ncbi:MAG: MFS transporter [Chloroflexi bacterium]|nr:MFS transporter [Chloroflexota bacterium]